MEESCIPHSLGRCGSFRPKEINCGGRTDASSQALRCCYVSPSSRESCHTLQLQGKKTPNPLCHWCGPGFWYPCRTKSLALLFCFVCRRGVRGGFLCISPVPNDTNTPPNIGNARPNLSTVLFFLILWVGLALPNLSSSRRGLEDKGPPSSLSPSHFLLGEG